MQQHIFNLIFLYLKLSFGLFYICEVSFYTVKGIFVPQLKNKMFCHTQNTVTFKT